jgi:hypothetical protein
MRRQLVLIAGTGVACVVAIALAASASAGRGALARVVDCVQNAGYSATVFNDSGLRLVSTTDPGVAVLFGDSNGMIRVREPSEKITVFGSNATTIAVIRVPKRGATTSRPGRHLPRHDRIVLSGCVTST